MEKEIAKAVKAETKRILEIVKASAANAVQAAKDAGDKASAKSLAALGKEVTAGIKAV